MQSYPSRRTYLTFDQVHDDDISNVLILNKKSIANQENQLFQAELEKFRPYQNRLVSTAHKQSSLLKDLTKTFGDLLQDRRVQSDQQKYETLQRSRNSVISRYKRVFGAHEDLIVGLMRAQAFYSEMKETVNSLEKNVESFVNNRRAEGAQLLSQIEQKRSSASSGQAAAERERLQQLMERMSMEPPPSSPNPPRAGAASVPIPSRSSNPDPRFTIPPQRPPSSSQVRQQFSPPNAVPNGTQNTSQQGIVPSNNHPFAQGAATPLSSGYNPMAYPFATQTSPPIQPSHPAHSSQQYFSPTSVSPNSPFSAQAQQLHQPPLQQLQLHHAPFQQMNFAAPSPPIQTQPPQQAQPPPPQQQPWQYTQQHPYGLPSSYVPPPPPPGPPGGGSQTQYPPNTGGPYPSGPGGYAQSVPRHSQQQQTGSTDPWAGLNAWR